MIEIQRLEIPEESPTLRIKLTYSRQREFVLEKNFLQSYDEIRHLYKHFNINGDPSREDMVYACFALMVSGLVDSISYEDDKMTVIPEKNVSIQTLRQYFSDNSDLLRIIHGRITASLHYRTSMPLYDDEKYGGGINVVFPISQISLSKENGLIPEIMFFGQQSGKLISIRSGPLGPMRLEVEYDPKIPPEEIDEVVISMFSLEAKRQGEEIGFSVEESKVDNSKLR